MYLYFFTNGWKNFQYIQVLNLIALSRLSVSEDDHKIRRAGDKLSGISCELACFTDETKPRTIPEFSFVCNAGYCERDFYQTPLVARPVTESLEQAIN